MHLYLRDDDTSFFTSVEELNSAFDGIWEHGPVNLAIIPYAVFTKNHGIKEKYFQDPSKEFFIGDNNKLVDFLKEKIKENKVTIMLHGYNHYYLPTNNKKYPFGIPEFVHSNNQFERISNAKNDLENLFNVEIKWFIPPSNSLTKETIKACDELKLNIPLLMNLKNRLWEILKESPSALLQNRLNKISNRNNPLKIGNHIEISCVSYTTETDFDSTYVSNSLNKIISTHYWELIKYPEIKQKVIKNIKQYNGVLKSMNDIHI